MYKGSASNYKLAKTTNTLFSVRNEASWLKLGKSIKLISACLFFLFRNSDFTDNRDILLQRYLCIAKSCAHGPNQIMK